MSGDRKSPAEQRILKAKLRILLQQRAPEHEILKRLSCDKGYLRWLRAEVQKELLQDVGGDGGTPADSFFFFAIQAEGLVSDLDAVIEEERLRPTGPNPNAIISATKAKADLFDQVFQRGQDLGVIHREPTRTSHTLIGGIAVGDLTTGEIRQEVEAAAKRLRLVTTTALGVDYGDEEDEDVFRVDPSSPATVIDATDSAPPQRKKVTA